MQFPSTRVTLGTALVLAIGACTQTVRPGPLPPSGALPSNLEIPPVPAFAPVPTVIGRLAIRVVHPPAGARVAARDSTFIFGSVGSGDARLTINGVPVPVLPNGSFLGWLLVPPPNGPRYELLATRGSDSVRLMHAVRLPPRRPVLSSSGPLSVDSASLLPIGVVWEAPDASVGVSLRAPWNSQVSVVSAYGSMPLKAGRGDSTLFRAGVPARWLADSARLVVTRAAETLSLALTRVTLVNPASLTAVTGTAPSTLPDTDRVTVVRPVPGGTYKWFLLPGTVLPVTGRRDGLYRVALDAALEGWVDATDVRVDSQAAPVRVAGNVRVVAGDGWTDVSIPTSAAPPYAVEVGERSVELTLYATTANTDIINYATADSLVERVVWEQVTSSRARYVISLRQSPYGYLVRYERGALTIRLRHAPRIDVLRPLAGLTIAVDAGHPPAGSTGPTGLYEPVATLPIADRLRRLLEGRGAQVVMTRTSASALGLAERPMLARRANAHAFVSIHLNALPDGVNPFRAHGTGTYYFTGTSVSLARAVQRGMVRRLGLRDLGINYDNLAVIRPTWMPAILCEGAFIMIPEQEAALRTPEFQEAYALGVAEGVEAYFRGHAAPAAGRSPLPNGR